jgi:hypothetical protein
MSQLWTLRHVLVCICKHAATEQSLVSGTEGPKGRGWFLFTDNAKLYAFKINPRPRPSLSSEEYCGNASELGPQYTFMLQDEVTV